MKRKLECSNIWVSVTLAIALLAGSALSPISATAQTPGNNAVCAAIASCATSPTFSSAFIDAFILQGTGANICATLYSILGTSPQGAVIDARGINNSSRLTCSSTNPSPWSGPSGYRNKPSTILLPAGTITIPSTWILPNGTKLIGEGVTQTIISALLGSFTSGPMLELGDTLHCPTPLLSSPPTCAGISVENLALNGNGQSVVGIENLVSQDLTYVDHVALNNITGIGLQLGTSGGSSAQGSGPYSHVTFDSGGAAGAICAQISVSGTRGVHGLSCTSTTDAGDAVYLDASNTSLEDIRIMGFYNGVVVGANAAAQNDVLLNVYGDTPVHTGATVNVINISTANTVTDLSILGTANPAAGTLNHTINDGLTSTVLNDQAVATYILGEASSSGGYSRFTTSKNAVTWISGNLSTAPSFVCSTGSLYSSTSNGSLYVCTPSSVWQAVP